MKEKASTETAKCPKCDSKYLVATGYCVKCGKKVAEPKSKDEGQKIKVVKEFRLPGTDIILEQGDEITVVDSAGETMSGDGAGSAGSKGQGVDFADESETNPSIEKDTTPQVTGDIDDDDAGEAADGDGTGDMGPGGKGIERSEGVITIKKEFRLKGTDIVLEPGDKIRVL